MGRPRKQIDHQRLLALKNQGLSDEAIATAMGESQATISRRLQEIREVPLSAASAARLDKGIADAQAGRISPMGDFSGEALPTDVATWDAVIATVHRNMLDAERAGAWPMFANLAGKLSALLTARRKAMPPAAPDPDASPDMILAKEKARAAFYRLLEQADAGKY